MATKIVLNRKKELVNRVRSAHVLIDGTLAGQIANGSSEGFEVRHGQHTIQCKISWFSSEIFTVNIADGETKFLRVKSGMKFYSIGYIVVLIALFSGIALRLAHIPPPPSFSLGQAIVVTPFALYILYYFTFGRKQYLVLEEDKDTIFS